MRTQLFVCSLLLSLLLGWLGAAPAGAQDTKASATGTWKWSTPNRTSGQATDSTLTLAQDGEKLTGALMGRNGRETAIEEGAVKNGEITFKITRSRSGQQAVTTYKGKVEGDTIKGTIEAPGRNGGQGRPRNWEAKRVVAAAANNPAGIWKWSFEIPNGGATINSTLRLKMVDGKLSGTLVGRRGETPITEAKLDGGAISFTVTRERNGQTFTSKYAGLLSGDTIKGKMEMGGGDQARSIDWEAKREKADATGTWLWTANFNGQSMERKVRLKQEGEKLSGGVLRGDGQETAIQEGKIQGNAVSFQVTFERNGESMVIKYAGKLEGDSLKGQIQANFGGQDRTMDWDAKRVKEVAQ